MRVVFHSGLLAALFFYVLIFTACGDSARKQKCRAACQESFDACMGRINTLEQCGFARQDCQLACSD